MRWIRALVAMLGIAMTTSSCRGDAYDIARRDDEALRSKVDKLMLLVSVIEESPVGVAEESSLAAPAGSRHYLDAARIADVTLRVDGTPLGTCATQAFAAGAAPGKAGKGRRAADTALKAEREAALVLCDFGASIDTAALKTVGAWVQALRRTVGAGAHVLEVTHITLRDSAGQLISHAARQYLPFVVEDGSATAFAGRAELVLPRSQHDVH